MNTPNIRILSQDFPGDVRTWINSLLIPLNQFMTGVSAILNKGITFRDHMNAEIKTVQVSSTELPTILHRHKNKPVGVLVIGSKEPLNSPVSVDWESVDGGIRLRRVFGLDQPHTLTFLIIGG